MANVADILAKKGRTVACVAPEESVMDAVWRMNDLRIGAMVVVGPDQQVIGMFTERDVLRRVVAAEKQPRETTVGEVDDQRGGVLPTEHVTGGSGRGDGAASYPASAGVHGRGEVGGGSCRSGDLNAWEIDGREETIHWLHEYISGRT